MPALVARIQRTVPLLLALLVPVAFIACEAEDPVAPTDLVSSTADAKGGNGKGGGPGGGGDDGGGDSGGSAPAIAGALVPGISPSTERLSMLDVGGDYLTGRITNASEDCGFVYSITDKTYECVVIPDAADGSVWIYGVRPDGKLAASYTAIDGIDRTAVFEMGTTSSLSQANLTATTTISPPDTYTRIMPASRRPINAGGQILVRVRRDLPDQPGPWRLGVVSADLSTVTMTSGDEYEYMYALGLSDDGFGLANADEFGRGDPVVGSWSLDDGTRLVRVSGTGGRSGGIVSGVFEGTGSGFYGRTSDGRPAVWATPNSSPVAVADLDLEPFGHDDGGRIFGRVQVNGNKPWRAFCVNPTSGLVTELLPPPGYDRVSRVRGSSGSVVFGNVGDDGTGTRGIAQWDLSEAEGGC
ncbi:MAG TPA: hypothetical protein VJ925_03535 [Longimicrobiales bacterium]|nr:hypothetical protein [Longimicrobiales bacterium]